MALSYTGSWSVWHPQDRGEDILFKHFEPMHAFCHIHSSLPNIVWSPINIYYDWLKWNKSLYATFRIMIPLTQNRCDIFQTLPNYVFDTIRTFSHLKKNIPYLRYASNIILPSAFSAVGGIPTSVRKKILQYPAITQPHTIAANSKISRVSYQNSTTQVDKKDLKWPIPMKSHPSGGPTFNGWKLCLIRQVIVRTYASVKCQRQ